ncbi:MAG: UvrB/UvrC motif-containing protein [Isosphaeraceae bacterium]
MRRDIDDALKGWPHDPEPGEILAREVCACDGRHVLQVRVELGILQLEIEGRPDGNRPHGHPSYLAYLRERLIQCHRAAGEVARLNPEQCAEVDREFYQYYHRRVAWLTLRRYPMAVRDADHTLALMDLVARHGPDADYILHHEKYRGLVLFHRTQAATLGSLEARNPEEAIDAVRQGIARLTAHWRAWSREREESEIPDEALIEQLQKLEADIRHSFAVDKTLQEQLDEAVAIEDYEKAARIRDQMRSRGQECP